MATITETYRIIQDQEKTNYPTTAKSRLTAAIEAGTIISRTVTPIVDSSEVTEGKTKMDVTIVWKSAEDRQNFMNSNAADSELTTYLSSSNTTFSNRTIV